MPRCSSDVEESMMSVEDFNRFFGERFAHEDAGIKDLE